MHRDIHRNPLNTVAEKEPEGLAYLPDRNQFVVASGGDGLVCFYDASSLALVGSIALRDDAENVRVGPHTNRNTVGCGSGALAIIDPARRAVARTVGLSAHPKGFQVDNTGRKAFVNLLDAHSITH